MLFDSGMGFICVTRHFARNYRPRCCSTQEDVENFLNFLRGFKGDFLLWLAHPHQTSISITLTLRVPAAPGHGCVQPGNAKNVGGVLRRFNRLRRPGHHGFSPPASSAFLYKLGRVGVMAHPFLSACTRHSPSTALGVRLQARPKEGAQLSHNRLSNCASRAGYELCAP